MWFVFEKCWETMIVIEMSFDLITTFGVPPLSNKCGC
jgi:hypothetical protein